MIRLLVKYVRRRLSKAVRHDPGRVFDEPRWLEHQHVQNCRVLPSRTILLEYMPKDAIVAEVGTSHGHFAREILRITRPTELHLIDRTFDLLEKEHFTDAIAAGQVRLHQSDSVRALEQFPDRHFDWIYIDADHTYEGVKRDIAIATRKVKSDGVLVFNDYTYLSPLELEEYGVVRAVNELCVDGGHEMLFFALNPLMYCDVALRRRT